MILEPCSRCGVVIDKGINADPGCPVCGHKPGNYAAILAAAGALPDLPSPEEIDELRHGESAPPPGEWRFGDVIRDPNDRACGLMTPNGNIFIDSHGNMTIRHCAVSFVAKGAGWKGGK